MVPMHIFLLFCLFGATFPPIDESEASRLSYVVDGRDSLGDGFVVLVENARAWKQESTTQKGIAEPADLSEIVANPAAYRGVEMHVIGVVEQPSAVDPPWNDVQEWFVRDETGSPFVLYVVGPSKVQSMAKISAVARYYKTINLTGRDGKVRTYATFVTSSEAIERHQPLSEISELMLLIPLIAIGGLVVFLLSRKKKSRIPRLRERSLHVEDVICAAQAVATELPDDPAQALALLHESAEELT